MFSRIATFIKPSRIIPKGPRTLTVLGPVLGQALKEVKVKGYVKEQAYALAIEKTIVTASEHANISIETLDETMKGVSRLISQRARNRREAQRSAPGRD